MSERFDDRLAPASLDRMRYVPARLRFGRFEADLEAGTLSRDGVLVKLQPQPFKVLVLLARRAGQIVTREEIRREVWGEETFVNFDQGLAYCLNQIRSALGEQAQVAQYIQTLPRRGYRFVAPVAFVAPALDAAAGSIEAAVMPVSRAIASADRPAWSRQRRLGSAIAVAVVVVATVLLMRASPIPRLDGDRMVVAVLPFEELGPEAASDHLGDGMTEEMITEIGRVSPDRVAVIARISAMRYKGKHPELGEIGRELGVSHVLEGTIRREHSRVRVTARLVRVADQAQVWARTFDCELGEILLLQAQVADDVARSVEGTLAPDRTRLQSARPMDPEVYALLARALIHLRRYAEAVQALEAAAARPARDRPRIAVFQARALAASGHPEEAVRSLAAVMQDRSWRDGRNDYYESAALLDQMGRRDDAFDALRKSLQARESIVRFALQDEALDGLRGDRRLDEIAQRLGLRY